MNKLFLFLKRSYAAILFVIVELVAFSVYLSSTEYTRARAVVISYNTVGHIGRMFSSVRGYFGLRHENQELLAYNVRLERELDSLRQKSTAVAVQQVGERSSFRYLQARVVLNTLNRPDNVLVVNCGRVDGVEEGMAVLSSDGCVAGYIIRVSENYSAAVSVLSTEFNTGGKCQTSDYMGSISWKGNGVDHVIMTNISRYADIHEGDQITTTGFSQYFPEDRPIGVVESFALSGDGTCYEAKLKLNVNIAILSNVMLVYNNNRTEILELLN